MAADWNSALRCREGGGWMAGATAGAVCFREVPRWGTSPIRNLLLKNQIGLAGADAKGHPLVRGSGLTTIFWKAALICHWPSPLLPLFPSFTHPGYGQPKSQILNRIVEPRIVI